MNKEVLTLGVFAHANAGKTTITEQILYHVGIIPEVGRVDDGNTVTDNLKIEQERGITVRDSLVTFELEEKKVQLIDTPGHVDFSAEVERAISVLDAAILVISGVEGLEAQTFTIWQALQQKKVPVIIFINKMDRLGANYDRALNELKRSFNISLLTLTRVCQTEEGILEIIKSNIEDLIEEIALVDEDILEKYIVEKDLDYSLIENKIIDLIKACKIFPVIGGSALTNLGINDLIECISKYLSPAAKKLENPFSAFIYSIRINEKGKNAYAKILNGSLNLRDTVKIGEGTTGKIKSLHLVKGAKLISVETVYSGDIVIINGLDVKCGQLIGDDKEFENYISFVNPLLTMKIKPLDNIDTIKLMNALRILHEEDPYLNIRYNEKTNSIYCNLMGEVQVQIIKTYLDERFNVKVNIENPVIIHKETPTIKTKAKVSYTSVSGIVLEVRPLEQGNGFRYVSEVSTDYLHIKYQRQIERLIKHYSKQGLQGWELTDMEVALIEGQFDSMGSDPMHFNIITPLALFRCLKQAKIKLLEPISSFKITAPESSLNAVMRLLSNKNATYELTKKYGEKVFLEGEVPSAKMVNFPVELSTITSGRGMYSSYILKYEFSHNQEAESEFVGLDPRNETTFLINDMRASLEPLDKALMKKKKENRSKFSRIQKEKLNRHL